MRKHGVPITIPYDMADEYPEKEITCGTHALSTNECTFVQG